jgi:hypothetical protein
VAYPTCWTRPRWSRLILGPALALAAAAAVAGCTSSPTATPLPGINEVGPTSAPTSTAALTTAQAVGIFDSYVATTARAARAGSPALALSVLTGVQQSTFTAALKSGSTFANGSPDPNAKGTYGQYRYGPPAVYLPEPAGYPRFFVADVTRTFTGTKPGEGMEGWVAGAEVPVDGPALMVFQQASATAPWLLSSVSQLAAGTALPTLAVDKNGYVPQVPLTATNLLAEPEVAGALQAAVVDGGQASTAVKSVAAGPLTTGMYQGAADHAGGLTPPSGDAYQWNLMGTAYSTFALRTSSGGALVLYAMYLNSQVAVPNVISDGSPVVPGPPIAVPADFTALLPAGKAAPRETLLTQQLLSFAAVDPPAGPDKVSVIAIGGGPNYATGH